ncbi:hypothetical protein ACO2Q3_04020 [Caulobacter sp. KR2-114]|uniref:hypothetical protein n=1 Tax=Caulobacter sp. KR2-114 TaxID=3400912 RepID=UPI003BFC56B0
MEELNKTHKEKAFGWVLTVQEMMRAVSHRRVDARIADQLSRSRPEAAPLDDLHNLAGPH